MKIAVLGPGGVGGLVAGALTRQRAADGHGGDGDRGGALADRRSLRSPIGGAHVVVLARDSTAAAIGERGLRISSVLLGDFTARPATDTALEQPVDVLIVATKAAGLDQALQRVRSQPALVLPLLNGLDHLETLRARFGEQAVVAGTIRVEADRPEAGVIVHTSEFLRIDMASRHQAMRVPMERLAAVLSGAGVPARVCGPISDRSEAQVMWSKLVRLNALALTTSAYDLPLGPIRSTPELRAELVGAIDEGCAVAAAEGADIPAGDPLGELNAAHDTLGSSMQRDIAAGRPPELDAIPGAVLRAGERHGIECPTIERLVAAIVERAGVPAPRRLAR
jgi:2-dehydropantoate 2-reductase